MAGACPAECGMSCHFDLETREWARDGYLELPERLGSARKPVAMIVGATTRHCWSTRRGASSATALRASIEGGGKPLRRFQHRVERADHRRVEEERDILKKAALGSRGECNSESPLHSSSWISVKTGSELGGGGGLGS